MSIKAKTPVAAGASEENHFSAQEHYNINESVVTSNSNAAGKGEYDFQQALDFLMAVFDGDTDITFQTFGEGVEAAPERLNRVLHHLVEGTLKELVRLHGQGAGVFVMVNHGDCKGRTAANVIAVNAVFVDLDGAPLAPVATSVCPPHIVVESSPGRYHAYWLVNDCSLEQFTPVQKALAYRFGGDPKVHDLSRVMRLPGFCHRKAQPFLTHIVSVNNEIPRYSILDLQQGLALSFEDEGVTTSHQQSFHLPVAIEQGTRNDTLFKLGCSLLAKGLSAEAAWAALVEENKAKCNPSLPEQELRQIFNSAQKYQLPIEGTEEEGGAASEKAPPKLNLDALSGLLGEFTRAACRNSEADPAAVAATFLVRFGIACGPKPVVMVGDAHHYTRLNAVIVGDSSKSRKGTSAGPVKALFDGIENGGQTSPGPLSSGEGIIYAVRDEVQEWIVNKKTGEGSWIIIDPGVEDKRLFMLDEEFAYALAATRREGNTLSSILRCFFDDGNAAPLTKNNRIKTTNAHVGIVTHITLFELKKLLTQNEQLNGFGNRFLWIYARRNGVVPFPQPLDTQIKDELRVKLSQHLHLAQAGGVYDFSPAARGLWAEEYPVLSMAHAGIAGAMVNRAEAMVIRISLIFACLAGHREIEREDLEAAISFWEFCEDSALYIFGSNDHDRRQAKIVRELKEKPDQTLSKNAIRKEIFDNHILAEELNEIIINMKKDGLVDVKVEQTSGAPRTLVTLKSNSAGNA